MYKVYTPNSRAFHRAMAINIDWTCYPVRLNGKYHKDWGGSLGLWTYLVVHRHSLGHLALHAVVTSVLYQVLSFRKAFPSFFVLDFQIIYPSD